MNNSWKKNDWRSTSNKNNKRRWWWRLAQYKIRFNIRLMAEDSIKDVENWIPSQRIYGRYSSDTSVTSEEWSEVKWGEEEKWTSTAFHYCQTENVRHTPLSLRERREASLYLLSPFFFTTIIKSNIFSFHLEDTHTHTSTHKSSGQEGKKRLANVCVFSALNTRFEEKTKRGDTKLWRQVCPGEEAESPHSLIRFSLSEDYQCDSASLGRTFLYLLFLPPKWGCLHESLGEVSQVKG